MRALELCLEAEEVAAAALSGAVAERRAALEAGAAEAYRRHLAEQVLHDLEAALAAIDSAHRSDRRIAAEQRPPEAEAGAPGQASPETTGDAFARLQRWRQKAEELRTIADCTGSALSQGQLRRLARTYDALADEIAARLAPPSAVPNRGVG